MSPALSKQLANPANADAWTALAERARRLSALLADHGAQPLAGRHVAIAAASHETPSARLFEQAALSLGARVSHIGADALQLEPARQEAAARILGCLYDAIEFIPLPSDRAGLLQRAAQVPIFGDLGGEASPLRRLVADGADAAAVDVEMVSLIQAVLVEALA